MGAGLLAGSVVSPSFSPAPEWWPFRNQIIVTLAASWALVHGFEAVVIGCVSSDGMRHVDGSPGFIDALGRLIRSQEGGIDLLAPAIDLSTRELIRASGTPREILGWTHSCHVMSIACGSCPGCVKHGEAFEESGSRG